MLIQDFKPDLDTREGIPMRNRAFIGFLPVLFLLFLSGGCQKVYYDTMEKFGVHKRDIMVDRVEDARDSQEEAKDQFQSALEQFTTVLNFKGGELEDKYKTLQAEYDKSEAKADEVKKRIDAVEDVSEALFAEWENELDQYSNASLRRDSERKMVQTRIQYVKLITAMRKAEAKIDPVLKAFRDQVLYLKHNLNAQAIASLQSELVEVESDIADLVQEMEKSIGEANSFIKTMLDE
jgi:predicted  nucleic acid-binding Zn-ribbon protein